MSHSDPQLSKAAADALAELDRRTRRKLQRALSRLANGYVDPSSVRVCGSPPREPPWQEVVLLDGIYVVFRRLAENERSAPDSPLLLVGTIATPKRLRCALQKLDELA